MIRTYLKSKITEDICLQLEFDNHKWKYLCDCGDASLLTVNDCIKTKALFVSHTHIDHFSNFDFLIRNQIGLEETIIICGPKGIGRNVQGKLWSYTWNLIEEGAITYEVREIVSKNRIKVYELRPPNWDLMEIKEVEVDTLLKNDTFSVRFDILDHATPSIAYLFEEFPKLKINMPKTIKAGPWVNELKDAFLENTPERLLNVHGQTHKAGDFFEYLFYKRGYSVAYVMDHLASNENHKKIIALAQGVDKLYIESYYRDADRDYAFLNHHSTAKESGKVARLAKVKHLHLVHHSKRYAAEVFDLVEEGMAAFEDRQPVFEHGE